MTSVGDLVPYIAAASRHDWATFPVDGKVPLCEWGTTATTAPDLASWPTKTTGYGIACGPSQLLVVDTDSDEAEAAWRELAAANGGDVLTFLVRTAKGWHRYYADPDGIGRNTASRLAHGVDTRGVGGFVVGPGSLHPSGATYQVVERMDPAPAPAWLLALVAKPDPVPTAAPADTVSSGRADAYVRGSVHRACERLLAAQVGQRNHELNREAHGVARVVAGTAPELEGLARDELRGAGLAIGLGEGEIAATLDSAFKAGRGDPRRPPADTPRYNGHTAPQDTGEYDDPYEDVPPPQDDPEDAQHPVDDQLTDWQRIDLEPIAREILAGTRERVQPTVLAVDGGLPLFYRARVNQLFGESGAGKTLVAQAAACERLLAGETVLIIDYEDHADGWVERLLTFGIDPGLLHLLDYRNPSTGLVLATNEMAAIAAEVALVIIDSSGEALAAAGGNPDKDDDVARWYVLVKKLLLALQGGPAVVVVDHIPKAEDAPQLFAIGSQRKRAAVTGAAYRVDTISAPARGIDGRLKLTVAKDRMGHRATKTVAAIVEVKSTFGGDAIALAFTISDGEKAAHEGRVVRPTHLMESVSRWLEINPGSTLNAVEEAVRGRKGWVATALKTLADEGLVKVENGPNRARFHTVIRPFREHEVTSDDAQF